MNLLKKLGLASAAFLFCLSLFTASGDAQTWRGGWNGNNGRHVGWTNGRHNGWNNRGRSGWNYNNVYWNNGDDRWRQKRWRKIMKERRKHHHDRFRNW